VIHEATGVVTNPEWVAYAPIGVTALILFVVIVIASTFRRKK
jgi:hypothetical protein